MMSNELTPASIFTELQKGRSYKTSINLYERVEDNENFFLGRQWEGVNAPSLDKPVFNFLKRVVNYFISVLVADDFAISITPFGNSEADRQACNILSREIERVIEKTNFKAYNRDLLRNCSVDGDACYFLRFDPDAETGQEAKGEIKIELIDNTKVIFGNSYNHEVQDQPYILSVQRWHVDVLKQRMSKVEGFDVNVIKADNDCEDNSEDLVTLVTRLYKKNGTVWFTQVVNGAVIKAPVDTGYKLYPVVYMCWERVKNSCHGQSAVEGLIPNQKAVNSLMAMAINHTKNNGFPMTFFNSSLFPNGFQTGSGKAMGVNGNPNEAFATSYRSGDMSGQVMQMIESIIALSKDLMGASDAALGNIKPDNTSAIVAVQRATAAPLDLQRKSFYQFIEDTVRVLVDMIVVNYGARLVNIQAENQEQEIPMLFDFGVLKNKALDVKVDIGASAYFSELMQLQTMDNLFARGIVTDAITYVEAMPDYAIRNKNKLLKKLREQAAQAMPVEQTQAAMQLPGGIQI